MDIMEKLCDDLRREVLSYVPTKTIKITDEFVEWWKMDNWEDTFLGLEVDAEEESHPDVTRAYENVKGNLELTVHYRRKGKEEHFQTTFIVGTIENMRKEWFNAIEHGRKYHEDEGQYDFPGTEWEDFDQTWKDYIWDDFYADGQLYYIAQA